MQIEVVDGMHIVHETPQMQLVDLPREGNMPSFRGQTNFICDVSEPGLLCRRWQHSGRQCRQSCSLTEVLHWQRSELFRLCDGDSQWAKRGRGDVKLLLHRKRDVAPCRGLLQRRRNSFPQPIEAPPVENSRCAAGVKLCFSRVGREVQGCLRNGKEMEHILVRIVGFFRAADHEAKSWGLLVSPCHSRWENRGSNPVGDRRGAA